jgi:tetratricopeptide (TPR) repeat protein
MNKENILFGVVGLLAGLIIGFMFANSVNQSAVNMATTTAVGKTQSNSLPPGHPDVPGGSDTASSQSQAMTPAVQATIDKAKSEPENFDAQMKAAEVYYQIQKFDGAIDFLTKANKLKPDDYGVIVQLGNANFDADKYPEAEKWYTAALAKKADDVNVRTDLGLTFVFRDPPNYDRAIQEFKKSLETDPNHIQTLQNLTVAYSKKGETANAKATLAKLESVDPSNSAIARLREDIEQPQQTQ